MKRFIHPEKQIWPELVKRPSAPENGNITAAVSEILDLVRTDGDEALRTLTAKFDRVRLDNFEISTEGSGEYVGNELKKAIRTAFVNIETFHRAQVLSSEEIETQSGVACWRESRAIDPVGLYVPGGSAPLFSSLLMLGIPARLAGCNNIVVCTPPDSSGKISPVISYTASLLDIDRIYAVGGAQAIGAMAYGTRTVPRVHKVFGPGNLYVTTAKQLIQQAGISIDMPAGPSEVLVIADGSADPAFVAADLLSQAEHGPDSQVVLASDSRSLIDDTLEQIRTQLRRLPRRDIAGKALEHSLVLEFDSVEEAMAFSNTYAPEHLIINTKSPRHLARKVESAGSVFIGQWSCESLGDYASGTNHTLPTAGFAQSYSGVSVDSFVKKITFQEVNRDGLVGLAPAVRAMALAEGLDAHERAVSIRLNSITHE